MAYTSLQVAERLQELANSSAYASVTIVTLAVLAKGKGMEHKAFARTVEDIVNAQTGKPMSTKLPYTIGAKLAGHIDPEVFGLAIDEAIDAAADYVLAHKAASAAIGATKWDAWNKIADRPIGDNTVGATLDAHDAAKAEQAAEREARLQEREALIAAGKASVPAIQPAASELTKVDREALVAAAFALIGDATMAELDALGAAIVARQAAIAEDQALAA